MAIQHVLLVLFVVCAVTVPTNSNEMQLMTCKAFRISLGGHPHMRPIDFENYSTNRSFMHSEGKAMRVDENKRAMGASVHAVRVVETSHSSNHKTHTQTKQFGGKMGRITKNDRIKYPNELTKYQSTNQANISFFVCTMLQMILVPQKLPIRVALSHSNSQGSTVGAFEVPASSKAALQL